MAETPHPEQDAIAASNDNAAASDRVDAVVVILARLLGRQMAREQFMGGHGAANDNEGAPGGGEP